MPVMVQLEQRLAELENKVQQLEAQNECLAMQMIQDPEDGRQVCVLKPANGQVAILRLQGGYNFSAGNVSTGNVSAGNFSAE